MQLFFLLLLSTFGAAHAFAAPDRGIVDISPPLSAKELAAPKLLFVDLNCLMCEEVISGVRDDPMMSDVHIVFVIAISQSKSSQAKMLWHLSNSNLYGRSSYGCAKNCSNIESIGMEPEEQPFLDQQIEWLKRRALIGLNTDVLINLFKNSNSVGRVPAFYDNGTLTIIDSANKLKELLHKKNEDVIK